MVVVLWWSSGGSLVVVSLVVVLWWSSGGLLFFVWGLFFACARAILSVLGLVPACVCSLFFFCFLSRARARGCSASRRSFSRVGRGCRPPVFPVLLWLGLRLFFRLLPRCRCLCARCLLPSAWLWLLLPRPPVPPPVSGFCSLLPSVLLRSPPPPPVCSLRSVPRSVPLVAFGCCCCCRLCVAFGFCLCVASGCAVGRFFRLPVAVPCRRLCVAFGSGLRSPRRGAGVGGVRSRVRPVCAWGFGWFPFAVGFLLFLPPVRPRWRAWGACLAFGRLCSVGRARSVGAAGRPPLCCLSSRCRPRSAVLRPGFRVLGGCCPGRRVGAARGRLVGCGSCPARLVRVFLAPGGWWLVAVPSLASGSAPAFVVLVFFWRPGRPPIDSSD